MGMSKRGEEIIKTCIEIESKCTRYEVNEAHWQLIELIELLVKNSRYKIDVSQMIETYTEVMEDFKLKGINS